MCPIRQSAISEEQFLELLEKEDTRKQFAHHLWETLGPDGQKWLRDRVLGNSQERNHGNVTFAKLVGAHEASEEKLRALELNALVNYFSCRHSLLSSALTAAEVAKMLGVSRQTIHERIRSGQLLGILENAVMKLPSWQFDPTGPNGVIEGLPEVLASMNCSLLGKISWLSADNPIFNGEKPIAALKRGELACVLREARAVGIS